MSNLHQLSIDTNQIDGVKALYLSSLLFIINPIIGIIIPAALAWNKANKTAFYKKQLKFIIIVIAVSSIIFYTIITLWFSFRILHYNYNFSDPAIPISAGIVYYIGTSAVILYKLFRLKNKQTE